MVLKEAREHCLRVIMSWATSLEQGKVTLVDFTLRADLCLRSGMQGMWCLEVGMGCDVVGKGLLCFVPLLIVTGS